MLNIADLEVKGRRVLVRADLNVPLDDKGAVVDNSRITSAIGGVKKLLSRGAAVIVASHLGRPTEGEWVESLSLAGVAREMSSLLDQDVRLIKEWFSNFDVLAGEVVLLENCRFNKGEKINSDGLAKKIASLCDIYCNDAFATAHRTEATTHGVAKFAKRACAGPLMMREIDSLERGLKRPRKPLVAIVGGAKVSTKLPVLDRLSNSVNHLIVGGGIANTFLMADGKEVGKSLTEKALVNKAEKVMMAIRDQGGSCPLPRDVVCAKNMDGRTPPTVKLIDDIEHDDIILDVGPETISDYEKLLKCAGTILWNGPIGVFENKFYEKGTKKIGLAIGSSGAFSIAGGGDTVAAINKFAIANLDYISTAGGAFLEFLEGKTLPAVAILNTRAER